jgi:hypothetical protein
VHVEAVVTQRGLEHRSEVVFVVHEEEPLAGHVLRIARPAVNFL